MTEEVDKVDVLIDKHFESIRELRNACAEFLNNESQTIDGVILDDLFFLRYVLSNKGKEVTKIAEKVRFNLEFRRSENCPEWMNSFLEVSASLDLPRFTKSSLDMNLLPVVFHEPERENENNEKLQKKPSRFTFSPKSVRKAKNPMFSEPATNKLKSKSSIKKKLFSPSKKRLRSPKPSSPPNSLSSPSSAQLTSTDTPPSTPKTPNPISLKANYTDDPFLAITHPKQDKITELLLSGYSGDFSSGFPVNIVRIGLSSLSTLTATFSKEDIASFLAFEKEKLFRLVDRRTRTSGKLVKVITVLDFTKFSLLSRQFSKAFLSNLGESSSLASKLYPQLQAKTCIVNSNGANAILSLIRKTMSKGSADKLAVCSAKSSMFKVPGAANACPFVNKMEGVDSLPTFLGGNLHPPNYLIPLKDRNNVEEVPSPTRLERLKVKKGKMTEIKVDILEAGTEVLFQGSIDSHHLLISAKLLKPFSGTPRGSPRGGDQEAFEESESGFSFGPREIRDRLGEFKVSWVVPEEGTLVIYLDNRFSKLKSKKVTYSIEVKPPQEGENSGSWFQQNFKGFLQWDTDDNDDGTCSIM
eukprot:maker-scaffold_15-snap-gene-5.56-mRNA-1 protein AED:0.15 eAED:0.19 QI:0/0/0/0.75/1/1/4/0/582